ncbi:hypothetical protein F4809DRAFT_588906 [Biscogniauxia mediterranea]|nr:hypothetical protein F4809DRAFT_588906 [Biscogniauxia mediterranea]
MYNRLEKPDYFFLNNYFSVYIVIYPPPLNLGCLLAVTYRNPPPPKGPPYLPCYLPCYLPATLATAIIKRIYLNTTAIFYNSRNYNSLIV